MNDTKYEWVRIVGVRYSRESLMLKNTHCNTEMRFKFRGEERLLPPATEIQWVGDEHALYVEESMIHFAEAYEDEVRVDIKHPELLPLNVVSEPENVNDIVRLLQQLLSEVESGELRPEAIVCVIETQEENQVRGFGDAEAVRAIGLLQLGIAELTK